MLMDRDWLLMLVWQLRRIFERWIQLWGSENINWLIMGVLTAVVNWIAAVAVVCWWIWIMARYLHFTILGLNSDFEHSTFSSLCLSIASSVVQFIIFHSIHLYIFHPSLPYAKYSAKLRLHIYKLTLLKTTTNIIFIPTTIWRSSNSRILFESLNPMAWSLHTRHSCQTEHLHCERRDKFGISNC